MTLRRCQGECGLEKPLSEFGIKRRRNVRNSATPNVYRSKVCKVCEVQRRLNARADNLYRHTFMQRRRNHARRWDMTVGELEALGWDIDRRSIEMQATFENGFCPNCIEIDDDGAVVVHFYREMTHGLADLTIDRIDPERPPIWPGNVQWLDKTCNQRKHRGDPILHGQWLQAEHEFRQSELTAPELELTRYLGPPTAAQRKALELVKTDAPQLFE